MLKAIAQCVGRRKKIFPWFCVVFFSCFHAADAANSGHQRQLTALKSLIQAEQAEEKLGSKFWSVSDPLVSDLATWVRMERSEPAPINQVILLFSRRSSWPLMGLLRERFEKMLYKKLFLQQMQLSQADKKEVRQYFWLKQKKGAALPRSALSPEGFCVQAWCATAREKQSGAFLAQARMIWNTKSFTEEQEKRFRKILSGARTVMRSGMGRLSFLVLAKDTDGLRRTLASFGPKERALARPILLFLTKKDAAERTWRRQPDAVRKHPLVLWAYMRWLVSSKKFRRVEAVFDVLDSVKSWSDPQRRKNSPDFRGISAGDFHRLRIMAARELLEQGRYKKAAALLQRHRMFSGRCVPQNLLSDYADNLWHAAWISLTFLNQPQKSKLYLEQFLRVVRSPISLARGHFWMGRTYQALKQKDMARASFRRALRYQGAFYGQMAAYKLGVLPVPKLFPMRRLRPEDQKLFRKQTAAQAVTLLSYMGKEGAPYIKVFLNHMATFAAQNWQKDLLLDFADRMHSSALVDLARYFWAKDSSRPLLRKAYPLCALPQGLSKEEKAVALSIIYKETRFDTLSVGGAGERGLMQVMLNTARKEAKALGVPYHDDHLFDPLYNINIGFQHYRRHKKMFQYVALSIGAYNAGEEAVTNWIRHVGHPDKRIFKKRFSDPFDRMIQWLEGVAFDSTRDYIQRFLEVLPIYRARLGCVPRSPVWGT